MMDNLEETNLLVKETLNKGKGLFTKTLITEGSTILVEKPLVACQFSWNRQYNYVSCDNCMRSMETAQNMCRRLTNNYTLELPHHDDCSTALERQQYIFRCPTCNIAFCSKSCYVEAVGKYHQSICFSPDQLTTDHPLYKIEEAWNLLNMRVPSLFRFKWLSKLLKMDNEEKNETDETSDKTNSSENGLENKDTQNDEIMSLDREEKGSCGEAKSNNEHSNNKDTNENIKNEIKNVIENNTDEVIVEDCEEEASTKKGEEAEEDNVLTKSWVFISNTFLRFKTIIPMPEKPTENKTIESIEYTENTNKESLVYENLYAIENIPNDKQDVQVISSENVNNENGREENSLDFEKPLSDKCQSNSTPDLSRLHHSNEEQIEEKDTTQPIRPSLKRRHTVESFDVSINEEGKQILPELPKLNRRHSCVNQPIRIVSEEETDNTLPERPTLNRRRSSVTFLVEEEIENESDDLFESRLQEIHKGAEQRSNMINKRRISSARKHSVSKYL